MMITASASRGKSHKKTKKINGTPLPQLTEGKRVRRWGDEHRVSFMRAAAIIKHYGPKLPETEVVRMAQQVLPVELRKPYLTYLGQVGDWFDKSFPKFEPIVVREMQLFERAREMKDRLDFDFLKPSVSPVQEPVLSKEALDSIAPQVQEIRKMIEEATFSLRSEDPRVAVMETKLEEIEKKMLQLNEIAAISTRIMEEILDVVTIAGKAEKIKAAYLLEQEKSKGTDERKETPVIPKANLLKVAVVGLHPRQISALEQKFNGKFKFTFVEADNKARDIHSVPKDAFMVYTFGTMDQPTLKYLRETFKGRLELVRGGVSSLEQTLNSLT